MQFKNYFQQNKFRIFVAVILILFGIAARFFRIQFLPELPNVEPITITALLAGALLGGGYALIVPLVIIAITDMAIGNSPILYFTWSAWAMIGLFSLILRKSNKENFSFGMKMTGMGISASLFFYVWTNFGVWLISGMYPHTAQGLITSYIMGLPFLKLNLLGNLVIVPVVSFSVVMAVRVLKVFKVHNVLKVRKAESLKI